MMYLPYPRVCYDRYLPIVDVFNRGQVLDLATAQIGDWCCSFDYHVTTPLSITLVDLQSLIPVSVEVVLPVALPVPLKISSFSLRSAGRLPVAGVACIVLAST